MKRKDVKENERKRFEKGWKEKIWILKRRKRRWVYNVIEKGEKYLKNVNIIE